MKNQDLEEYMRIDIKKVKKPLLLQKQPKASLERLLAPSPSPPTFDSKMPPLISIEKRRRSIIELQSLKLNEVEANPYQNFNFKPKVESIHEE
ncbi:hypothetical protein FGO68_gene243 [Halteria grandinella]|uniref:Uncharacterized protein n=1 Tax=Halteria grandinella TaxID=5974 RepID=A0A8J8NDV5_HALGN|nr:hypothetical protein FGO68_gene243 [Halteria grandinella]